MLLIDVLPSMNRTKRPIAERATQNENKSQNLDPRVWQQHFSSFKTPLYFIKMSYLILMTELNIKYCDIVT